MHNFERKNRVRDWARLAARLGLLLTEPRVRAEIRDRLDHRVDDFAETIGRKYDDAVHRVESASDALRGKSQWPSHAVAVLLGLGIGAGVGMLIAPTSGRQSRQAIRDKALDLTKKAAESASSAASHVRSSAWGSATGTEG